MEKDLLLTKKDSILRQLAVVKADIKIYQRELSILFSVCAEMSLSEEYNNLEEMYGRVLDRCLAAQERKILLKVALKEVNKKLKRLDK